MRISLCLLLFLVGSWSCTTKSNEISGHEIEISFIGDFKAGEWVDVDGVRFVHQITDTTAALKATYEPFSGYTEQNVSGEEVIIPPTIVYIGLDDKWGQYRVNQAQIAHYFVVVFKDVMAERNEEFEFTVNEPVLFTGRVAFKRKNNAPVTIKTSSGYPGSIRVIN